MRFFATCLLPFALFFAGCRPPAAPIAVSEKPISINNVPQTNLPFPPTTNIENLGWKTFDGKQQKFAELKGKVVVLDFWATYCPPCIEAIPHLVNLQDKYGSDNFQIVGLNVGGEEDAAKVPAFVEKFKMNYIVALPDDELANLLMAGNSAIPQTFVFDRGGKLLQKFVGYDLKVKNDLEKAIEQAFNQ